MGGRGNQPGVGGTPMLRGRRLPVLSEILNGTHKGTRISFVCVTQIHALPPPPSSPPPLKKKCNNSKARQVVIATLLYCPAQFPRSEQ